MFGLRLLLASDDFVFPAFIEGIIRLVFLLLLVAVFALYVSAEGFGQDTEDLYVEIYLVLSVALFLAHTIVSFLLCWDSSKGSIWDPNESVSRKHVVPLFYASTIFTFVEIIVNGFGSFSAWKLLSGNPIGPGGRVRLGILMITVALWLCFLVKLLVLLCSIKELNDSLWRSRRSHRSPAPEGTTLSTVSWSNKDNDSDGLCIKLLTRMCFREDDVNYFHEAAEILAEIFRHDMLLLSDIVSALVILFTKSRYRRWSSSTNMSMNPMGVWPLHQHLSTQTFSKFHKERSSIRELINPETMLRFMEYSYAMYGSALYIISSKSTVRNCGKVLKNLTCCACCCCFPIAQRSDFVVGDGCCQLGVATVKATLGDLEDDDFVYMSFKNLALVSPFMVTVDHRFKSIVISIRGSGSIPDLITDLSAQPKVMADVFATENLSKEFKAHGGMAQSALYIYRKLTEENILHKAFTRCDNYKIVVTGHSLGAGIATVLGFFLRTKYPQTFVFAYGPPGGLINFAAWKESKKFICSVVVGHDVVARLSLRSIYQFREIMRCTLEECQEPKYKILYRGLATVLKAFFSCCSFRDNSNEEFDVADGSISDTATDYTDYGSIRPSPTGSFDSLKSNDSEIMIEGSGPWPSMLPPGIFHHIQRMRRRRGLNIVQVDNPHFFADILVSPNMLTDHFPQSYVNALRRLTTEQLHSTGT